MSELVSNGLDDDLFLVLGRQRVVGQQRRHPERDEAPVFHGAGSEARDRNHV